MFVEKLNHHKEMGARDFSGRPHFAFHLK